MKTITQQIINNKTIHFASSQSGAPPVRAVQYVSGMHLINHENRPSVCHRARMTNCETTRRHPTAPEPHPNLTEFPRVPGYYRSPTQSPRNATRLMTSPVIALFKFFNCVLIPLEFRKYRRNVIWAPVLINTSGSFPLKWLFDHVWIGNQIF